MTEDEARDWISDRFGASGRQAMETLVASVINESANQNLIAQSTVGSIWTRHVVDSAQLIDLASQTPGPWLDIGTGAGFPGLVIAAMTDRHVTMVEPRKRRADFLKTCCAILNVSSRTTVMCTRVEAVWAQFAAISARAVAPLPVIFSVAEQCSTWNTVWLLPKGRAATEEIGNAEKTWHATFHVEQSLTDPDAQVVIAEKVRRR